MLPRCFLALAGLLHVPLTAVMLQIAAQSAPAALKICGLGKGIAPLDVLWRYHIGDNPAWALPQTGSRGWEQISPNAAWGAQGHPAYTGYAWYRKQVHITPAPKTSPDLALLIRRIDDAYEIYRNGQLVGNNGAMPPNASLATGERSSTRLNAPDLAPA